RFVLFCFFFQAEDGIRDRNVTGVQTCALPISTRSIPISCCAPARFPRSVADESRAAAASLTSQGPLQRRGRLESDVAGESRAAAVAGAGSGAISVEVRGAGRGQPLEQARDGRGGGGGVRVAGVVAE